MPNRTPAAVALAAIIALVLAGCVQQPPRVLPTATPSVAPVFKTDAEALAAARKTYVAYLRTGDSIGQAGGNGSGKIAPYVTAKEFDVESKDYAELEKSKNHLKGTTTYFGFKLQSRDQSNDGRVSLSAYVCDDFSKSRIVNHQGNDITSKSRMDIVPVSVVFESAPNDPAVLLVGGSTPWSGVDFCSR